MPPPPPPVARLAGVYARVAAFTFGGGDPTMAALQTELVRNRGWLTRETFSIAYGLARITPGTNMLAFIAGSAWAIAGWRAAAAAVAATILPAAALVVLFSAGYDALRTHPRAMAAIAGTLAAAVGLMAAGAWQLVSPQLLAGRWPARLRALALAGAALGFSLAGVSPVWIIAAAAAAGAAWPASESP